MMKPHRNLFIALILSLGVLLCPNFAFAADGNVELEWEGIENAKSYDLEVKSTRNTFKFNVIEPVWVGKLSPGVFKMRVRGRDKRGVPGEWSGYQEFKVFLDLPPFVNPTSGSVIASSNPETQNVSFKWKKVFAAKRYTLDVRGLDSPYRKQVDLTEDVTSLEVPVATKFQATVRAANEVLTSNPEQESMVEFVVSGQKVGTPQIVQPESYFVREIGWKKPQHAERYSYVLEKMDTKAERYNVFDEGKDLRTEKLSFKKEWPGGIYKLTLRAQANYRPQSDAASIRFTVKDGDRTEKAEELARLRESIERLSGWFGMASYLITAVQYQNNNYDLTNTQITYSAIGGTLRAGVGYVTKRNPWGYFVAIENSFLTVEGFGDINYKMLELNSFFKMKPNDAGEFRQTAGLVYKELPDITQSESGHRKYNSVISAMGFRYGAEYWLAITPKLGLQANGHIFPLISGKQTTNGQAFVPSTSVQAGFLVSYRFSKNLTVLGGYAYRNDKVEYKTAPTADFPEPEADKNSINLKGHYLNLFMEYQL